MPHEPSGQPRTPRGGGGAHNAVWMPSGCPLEASGGFGRPQEACIWKPLEASEVLWRPSGSLEALWRLSGSLASGRRSGGPRMPQEPPGCLRRPQDALGGLWNPLEASGSLQKPRRCLWKPSGGRLEAFWRPRDASGCLWKPSGGLLEAFWKPLDASGCLWKLSAGLLEASGGHGTPRKPPGQISILKDVSSEIAIFARPQELQEQKSRSGSPAKGANF